MSWFSLCLFIGSAIMENKLIVMLLARAIMHYGPHAPFLYFCDSVSSKKCSLGFLNLLRLGNALHF